MKTTILSIIIVCALILLGCKYSTSDSTSTQDAQDNELPPTSPSTQITTAVTLYLLNYRSYIEYGSYISFPSSNRYSGNFLYIVGEFYNSSSQNVRLGDDKITVTFYDADGSVIDVDADIVSKHRYLDDETIPPGGKWPFKLIVLDEEISHSVASYELSAKGKRISEEIPQVEIISYRLFPNKYHDLIGEVQNTTDYSVEVVLLATFYDEDGLVLDADAIYDMKPLCPGEKAPFWDYSYIPAEAKRCEIVTRYTVSEETPYREFEVLNIAYEEGITWDSLTGEVRNTGQQSVSSVWLYASFYNDEGELIDCRIAGVEPKTLEPGGTGTFEIEPLPSPPWQMPNYSLLIYALQ